MAASLGPARFCANCLGKKVNLRIVETPSQSPIPWQCFCSNCCTEKFSRCGGCHLVPYCSKECQLEHRSHHKKLCKDLARRERRPVTPEVASFWQFWTSDPVNGFHLPSPKLPNPAPEIAWIDAYLTNLLRLVSSVCIEIQEVGEEEMFGLFKWHKCTRGYFLFLSSWLKEGKLTEFHLAQYFFGYSLSFFSIAELDSKIRDKAVQNEVWETLIFQLAKFFQILRMVKYKFINIMSIKKKKPAQYRALKPFYESGLKMFESSTAGSLNSQSSRISLPPGTLCVGCKGDLGGKEAQLFLNLAKDSKMIRVPSTPCVLDMSDTAKNIVVCGKHEACSSRAKALYQQLLQDEMKALMDVLPDTKICHGCSRYSLKTHRVSRCREARYCSQDWLNQDWKEHKIRCREFTRPGIKELYDTKKLEGEARMIHTEDCLKRICFYDPFLASANCSVKQKNEEVD